MEILVALCVLAALIFVVIALSGPGDGKRSDVRHSAPGETPSTNMGRAGHIAGDGGYDAQVAGESHYQRALRAITRGNSDSFRLQCIAELVPEPTNPYDPDAIRVVVADQTVGYIPRNETADYHPVLRRRTATCSAIIVGGRVRDGFDIGNFGVLLDVAWPPRISGPMPPPLTSRQPKPRGEGKPPSNREAYGALESLEDLASQQAEVAAAVSAPDGLVGPLRKLERRLTTRLAHATRVATQLSQLTSAKKEAAVAERYRADYEEMLARVVARISELKAQPRRRKSLQAGQPDSAAPGENQQP